MRKRIIGITTSIALALGMSSSIAAPISVVIPNHPTKSSVRPVSTLFVISVETAAIKQQNSGTYKLRANLADISQITVISDGQNRVAQTITGENKRRLWELGEQTFTNNYPSTVVSTPYRKPITAFLVKTSVTENRYIDFYLERVGSRSDPLPSQLSNLDITIDADSCNPCKSLPTGGGLVMCNTAGW
jgi:hypothetical protein